MKHTKGLFVFIFLMTLPGCSSRLKKYYNRQQLFLKKAFFAGPIPAGPATVFIHGTKVSLISRIVHKLDYPLGILPKTLHKTKSVLTKIATSLNQANPQEFPLDTFYFYGWVGKLTFKSRVIAAEQLYEVLNHHNGPLTIITHSHGSSVALNLACVAEERDDKTFTIDRLIMLAPPVQEVTKQLVYSPVFKEVYTFYSSADLLQIGDAQGLYRESYTCTPPGTKIPFFSKRTFAPAPNIIQTRVLLDFQSPGHLHFMLGRFIRKLPALLKLVKEAAARTDYEKTKNHFIVNIPLFNQPPHLVESCELKKSYVPRSHYYKLRQRFK